MKVKTIFLNSDLEEEVYIEQPKGFVMNRQEKKVCKFVKLLFGLKQASKKWHKKLSDVMLSNEFIINEIDKYIYVITQIKVMSLYVSI